jgi:TonB-dependent SusC/RagA subfamily outer membrane receptor
MMRSKAFFIILILILSVTVSSGQKGDKMVVISGAVTDAKKNPVEGAVFYIDNLKTSYRTKSNGSYKIKVSPSARKLSVRTNDWGSRDTIINELTIINFTLPGSLITDNGKQEEEKAVKEVNSSGSPENQRSETTKVNKIDGTINKYASYKNIYEILDGKVPGVQVSGKTITIRGQNSVNGNSQPVFVVDGSIVYSIDDINPVDVKSIEVLKGAAAALYGYQGANGVISITLVKAGDTK